MPQSYIEYSSGLTATTFSVPFKYLNIDNVNAIGFDGTNWTALTVASRSASANTITLASSPSTFTKIRVFRQSTTNQLVDFQAGARLTESELDTAYNQGLFVAQEVSEDANTVQFSKLSDAALLGSTSLAEFNSSSHTGDNSTVTFTLSFTPQTSIPQGFLVIVDGVLQSPVDAYTISIAPAQITFTSAPPTGASIVVTTAAAATGTPVSEAIINGSQLVDGSINTSKLASVTATGSTQPRSLSDRFADVVNVKDFGAVGDGTTDDTTAIQAAINSVSSGGTIFIPKGTYIINSQLNLRSGNSIVGESRYSSTLKAANGFNGNILRTTGTSPNNISVRTLGFNGNSTEQTSGNLLNFEDVTSFEISECNFKDAYTESILLRSCSKGQVSNNECINSGGDGISLSFTSPTLGKNISINNNYINNPSEAGINLSGQKHVTVTGNVVEHDATGGTHSSGHGGIRLTNGSTLCVATGNSVQGMSRGLFVVSTAGVLNTLVGNTISNSGLQGILIEQSSQLVSSNTIDDSGKIADSSSPFGFGIQVSGACQSVQIQNNSITGNTTMEKGIVMTTTGSQNVIVGNRISGNTAAALTNEGGGKNIFRDNQFNNRDLASGETEIASASTIVLPPDGSIFNITGTTNITAIEGIWAGRTVSLRFASALTVSDSSSLKLAGDFITSNSDVLTLTTMDTTTFEVSRSVN